MPRCLPYQQRRCTPAGIPPAWSADAWDAQEQSKILST